MKKSSTFSNFWGHFEVLFYCETEPTLENLLDNIFVLLRVFIRPTKNPKNVTTTSSKVQTALLVCSCINVLKLFSHKLFQKKHEILQKLEKLVFQIVWGSS